MSLTLQHELIRNFYANPSRKPPSKISRDSLQLNRFKNVHWDTF